MYSTDSLNRFKMEETTTGNVSVRFLVKKFGCVEYFEISKLLWIKSNVFFRSNFMLLRHLIFAYYAHVFIYLLLKYKA